MVTVPLYDTLGAEAVDHILKEARVEAVLCHHANVGKVLSLQRPDLRAVVKIGEPTAAERQAAQRGGVELCSLDAVAAQGRQTPCAPSPPHPNDVATVCYTSGTTGLPKGAVLTHANIMADVAGVLRTFEVSGCRQKSREREDGKDN